jgi:membrane-anchored protein YejM (alkaline phosphatase superfamily)
VGQALIAWGFIHRVRLSALALILGNEVLEETNIGTSLVGRAVYYFGIQSVGVAFLDLPAELPVRLIMVLRMLISSLINYRGLVVLDSCDQALEFALFASSHV